MILKWRLHKFLTLIISIICLSITVFAQTRNSKESNCSLTLRQAPEIRGLRLGMTLEQLLNIYPSIKRNPENVFTPNEIGIMKDVIIKPELKADRSKLRGIDLITLGFMDGRLLLVSVFYDNSITWNSISEFTNRISESLNLPNSWQEYRPLNDEGRYIRRYIRCEGFEIFVLTGGKYYSGILILSDLAARRDAFERELKLPEIKRKNELEGKRRKAESEERKRKEFKP